jgi:hypothetical protein
MQAISFKTLENHEPVLRRVAKPDAVRVEGCSTVIIMLTEQDGAQIPEQHRKAPLVTEFLK